MVSLGDAVGKCFVQDIVREGRLFKSHAWQDSRGCEWCLAKIAGNRPVTETSHRSV